MPIPMGDDVESGDSTREALAAHAVRKINLVPGTHRRFTDSASDAARRQRITADVLDLLLDLGLPHRGAGPERLFDPLDLENVSLALRQGPRWSAMRWWPRSLRESARPGDLSFRLTVRVTCPTLAEPHDCELVAHPEALASAKPADLSRLPDGFTMRLTTTSVDHVFGTQQRALVDRMLPVEYHLIPDALSGDLGFVAETALADCRLAARYAVHLGGEMGLGVRLAQGLMLARPYPGWHTWVEFHTGVRWLAADPFLLSNLHRWGLLTAAEWPAYRSPAAILCRWQDDLRPLVTHRGEWVRSELAVSPEPARSPHGH
jgi:hypothetical protein